MDDKKIKLVDAASDPWMRRFVDCICDFFGVPASSIECNGINDRLMFSWAMLSLAKAVKDYSELLKNLRRHEPDIAAELFARAIYDDTGKLAIPALPIADPPVDNTTSLGKI